jgi:uncharacterized repeat protein (TIGR01451 family)
MRFERTLGRRLAKALALVTLATAGLAVGVPSGAAGFGLGLQSWTDGGLVPSDVVLTDPTPSADLSVAMSDSMDPATVGVPFEYDLTVANLGPYDATGAYLSVALPDGLTLDSVSGASCSRDGDLYCSLGNLGGGASVAVALYVHALQTGSFSSAARVWSQTSDLNGDNNGATESTEVVDRLPDVPRAHLNVVTHVVDDNGGSAKAGDFDVVLDGVDAKPSFFAGDEGGTSVGLNAGDYRVALEDGPSGYDASFSDNCSGSIGADETKTCTITLDDRPAHLTVVTQVHNDHGGTAASSDFALAVKGGSPNPAEFNGDVEGTDVTLDAGGYAVSQETALGYRTTLSEDCQGTIGPGESKTCTVSNVDLAAIGLSLSADAASVPAGGTTGYTATLTNSNDTPVTVSYVSVWLPTGFSYKHGSTTGATTADPSIDQGEGLYLSWQGPGELAGTQSTAFHFRVTVPKVLGDYQANASGGVVAPYTLDSSSTPDIVVVKGMPTPPPSSSPPAQDPAPSDPNQNQTTTVSGPPPVGPPVFQQDVDVQPVSGDVLVRLPGTTDFVPLTDPAQIGFGTEIDATNGRVGLSSVDASGTVYHADFYEGRFILKKQLANGVTVLWLSGSDFKSCKTVKRTLSSVDKKKPQKAKKVKRSKKVVRHLWGSGKGKFRTKGRFIAATVHGTTWLTEDRCDGSRAFVQEGVIDARDLVRHKTIRLGAGQSYVARPH